jgi:hypothetical protein
MLWRFGGGFAYELIEATTALLAHSFHARDSELRQFHFDNVLCSLFGPAVVKPPRGHYAPRSLIPWRGTNCSKKRIDTKIDTVNALTFLLILIRKAT